MLQERPIAAFGLAGLAVVLLAPIAGAEKLLAADADQPVPDDTPEDVAFAGPLHATGKGMVAYATTPSG